MRINIYLCICGVEGKKMKRKWAKMTKNGILKRIRWYIFSTIKENKNDVIFLSFPIPILVFTSNPLQLLLLLLLWWCRENENLRVTKNGKNQIELMCLFPSWIHCIPSTMRRLVHMVVHVHCSLDTTMNTELYVCDCVLCHLQAKGRRYCNIFQFFVLFCYFMLFNSVKVNGSVLFNWNWILQTLEQSKL